MRIDGAGRVHAVASIPVLRPEEQIVEWMRDGWRNQHSLQLIAALCDIFTCDPGDLLTVTAADARHRKTVNAAPPNVVTLDRSARPRRANILDD